jgi:GT2 family glycosyltransferase
VLRRVRRLRWTPVTPTPATHFGPFSIALISRPLWDALGGFDPHLIYTFEDADFGRRAVTRAAHLAFCPADRTQHKASSTSRRHVDLVLPVAVWSASNYLSKWFVGPRTARSLCLAALLVRCLAVPFAHLDRRTHLTGIRRAARSLVTGQAPSLPPYESN